MYYISNPSGETRGKNSPPPIPYQIPWNVVIELLQNAILAPNKQDYLSLNHRKNCPTERKQKMQQAETKLTEKKNKLFFLSLDATHTGQQCSGNGLWVGNLRPSKYSLDWTFLLLAHLKRFFLRKVTDRYSGSYSSGQFICNL